MWQRAFAQVSQAVFEEDEPIQHTRPTTIAVAPTVDQELEQKEPSTKTTVVAPQNLSTEDTIIQEEEERQELSTKATVVQAEERQELSETEELSESEEPSESEDLSGTEELFEQEESSAESPDIREENQGEFPKEANLIVQEKELSDAVDDKKDNEKPQKKEFSYAMDNHEVDEKPQEKKLSDTVNNKKVNEKPKQEHSDVEDRKRFLVSQALEFSSS
jgi:hypothetical protein